MITNPQPVRATDPDDARDLENERPAGKFRVRPLPLIHTLDPDREIENLFKTVDTRIVAVDAKLVERVLRDRRTGRRLCEVVHYPTLQHLIKSPTVIRNIKERYQQKDLKELGDRMVELRRTREAAGGFDLGLYDDEVAAAGNSNIFRLQDTFLPSTNSPYTKQMLFGDFLDAHRKVFEAATKNPIAKRICKIVPQFVLGRGVKGVHKDPAYQLAWDDFAEQNKLRLRLKVFLRELMVYGEIFLRYFNTRNGQVLRSIDPSTIWDIATEPDDLESILYYHQQYVILNTSVVPDIQANTPSTLVIRQIPAEEIDHFKINATSSEKRGRSELLPILGWLVRFKEYANDRVLLNKIRSMFALDVSIDGDVNDVAAAEEQFRTPPNTGAVMVHNKSVEVEFKGTNTGAVEAKTDADLLLRIIAIGSGISESFLGVGNSASRASALISTEPDVKNFEDYQEIVDEILHRMSDRVFTSKGLSVKSSSTDMEFVFPAIAQEDRSGKLQDIAFAESMDYFSKQRAAEMAAREFNITTYKFDKEQEQIEHERKADPLINATLAMVPKEPPAPPPMMPGGGGLPGAGGLPAGGKKPAAAGAAGAKKPGAPPVQVVKLVHPPSKQRKAIKPKGVRYPGAEAGFRAKRPGGRALPDTKATLNRSKFTHGSEKKAIKNNRTSGTPTREAEEMIDIEQLKALQESERKRRPGWTDEARQKSLATRRANKQAA